MLLTKPLTTFLNANRTPQLQTLALITPSGKVLSSSSTSPAPVLRAQATLACSLWTLYNPLAVNGTLSSTLPSRSHNVGDAENHSPAPDPDVSSILIQLEHGTMVIRALKCSLLFIAISPPSPSSSHIASSSARPLHQDLSHLSMSATSPPSSRGGSSINGDHGREGRLGHDLAHRMELYHNGNMSSAASDAGSSTAGGGASMRVLKRQAEELAKWLEEELDGFSLSTAL